MQQESKKHSKAKNDVHGTHQVSTARAAVVFGASAAATLVCGVVLEVSGDAIAGQISMTGVLFGATVLVAATSLPELSTGLASMNLGDDKLAISDIFGGNAFLPVLFLSATLISGKAALPQAQDTDVYLAGLGILLTCIYLYGFHLPPAHQGAGHGRELAACTAPLCPGCCRPVRHRLPTRELKAWCLSPSSSLYCRRGARADARDDAVAALPEGDVILAVPNRIG